MFATCLALTLALAPAPAPQELPRAVPPKDSIVVDPARHETTSIVVKLAEGSDAATRAALDAAVAGRRVRPFFHGLEAELAQLRERVLAATPENETPPADLSLYHEVATHGLADSRALLAALNRHAWVEIAYPRELPTPPPGDIPPLTPSFVSRQGYAGPAPNGVDGGAIRSLTGAWGGGIAVLDIEWGWWFDHEDIAKLRPSSLVGPPISRSSFNNHGTAVSGELAGDPDEWGVTGLVPDIKLLVATDFPASGYSVARAILVGLPFLKKGDVMLLEAQTRTPLGLGPTEWVQADFDAIQNATRAGVITVEAAGNGGVNLDDPRLNRLFDLSVRDSGAIIVGATEGSALRRASFSCYGARIDANGWGRNVATTGYGHIFNPNRDRRQRYTATFSGTSSASPIVTSAVVAILGAARTQLGPAEAAAFGDFKKIRALLRSHGTPVPGTQNIGRRPDLAATFRAADLERGLRILDAVQIGKSARLEIEPTFAASTADGWGLLGAPRTANVGLPLPDPLCNRLLLDAATMLDLAAGRFNSAGKATVPVPVPNDARLIGARFYWQVVTFDASTRKVCLTNSAHAFVQR